MSDEKTNVMRILDKAHIPYDAIYYEHRDKEAVDGITVAQLTGMDEHCVFKTLVLRGVNKNIYIFVIPVCCELDLKKAARSVCEKAVQMVHVNEINSLTGYIRGGCSPIGMRKKFKTVFHRTIINLPYIMVSAGKIGCQVRLKPDDLLSLVDGDVADIII